MSPLLKFDLIGLRRDGIALTVIATLVAACLLAVINGAAVVIDGSKALRTYVSTVETAQDELPKPISPSAVKRAVCLPTGRVASLSLGRSRLDPWFGQFDSGTLDERLFANYQTASPLALQAGGFDLGFVATVIAPLLIIALGYGIVVGERDSGRLRTLLSYPVKPTQLLLQRILVRTVLVGAIVSAFAILGAALAAPAEGLAFGRVVLWLLVAWLSMLFWWALVGFANTLKIRAETAAMGLVAAWAVLVLVVPALIAALAAALYPPPSRQVLTAEMRRQEVVARDSASDDMKRFMHDHPDLQQQGSAYVADYMKAAVIQRQRLEHALRGSTVAFKQQLAAQRRVADVADYLSPALGLSHSLAEVAGTSAERSRAFQDQSTSYKREIQAKLTPFLLSARPLTTQDVASLRPFAFQEPLLVKTPVIATFWSGLTALVATAALRRSRRVSAI